MDNIVFVFGHYYVKTVERKVKWILMLNVTRIKSLGDNFHIIKKNFVVTLWGEKYLT